MGNSCSSENSAQTSNTTSSSGGQTESKPAAQPEPATKAKDVVLMYFNARGRGETIRLIFAMDDADYEDRRIEKSDWPALKPNTPWGTLPVLDRQGVQYGQSKSVARLAARVHGLAGKDDQEAALADGITDEISDLMDKMFEALSAPDPEKGAKMEVFQNAMMPSMTNLEKILVDNNGGDGYLVGSNITWADLHFFQFAEHIMGMDSSKLDSAPKLKALYSRVAENPKIAAYLKNRPKTDF